MPILRGDKADSELNDVCAIEDFDVGSDEYPLTRLTADDFERLNYALFKVSGPPSITKDWDDVALMLRGADAGRDVALYKENKLVGVVQCKRLESRITLPQVLREAIKLILFPCADKTLPKMEPDLTYFLSLATESARTVIDFFSNPAASLAASDGDLPTYVNEVIDSFETLSQLDKQDAVLTVRRALPTLHFKLLRPVDLSGWLAGQEGVAGRFFKQRVVVDNSFISTELKDMKELMRNLSTNLAGVPLLTDVDLKIIKDRIDGTPDSHRISTGFAALFGFPREMFSDATGLKRRIGRLVETLNELNADYTEWLNEKARAMAGAICDQGEVIFTVHPFARQIPLGFLGMIARECLERTLTGEIMGEIIRKLNPTQVLPTDDDKLLWLRERFLEEGKRYLQGDYSNLAGDAELLALKRRMISHMLQGLQNEEDVGRVLDEGLAILRPRLLEAAKEIRRLGAYSPSVFLMGVSGIDMPEVVKRMAETAKALDAMKSNTSLKED